MGMSAGGNPLCNQTHDTLVTTQFECCDTLGKNLW
jgi:hypothetical protein